MELLKAVVDEDGNSPACSAYEDALSDSMIYKSWQKVMPGLKDVPNIHNYQNRKCKTIDPEKVNQKIMAFGAYLPKGQILYRGDKFTETEISIYAGPTSTSLKPENCKPKFTSSLHQDG